MQIAIIAASLPLSTRPQPERGNYAVILTSGPEDGGKRATLALAAACTAQPLDLNTIVFLVADGVHCLAPAAERANHSALRHLGCN